MAEEEEVFLNTFGMEIHETDVYIDWNQTKKKKIKLATELREAFDKIEAAGLSAEMETLITAVRECAYQEGREAEWEMNAGPEW